MNKLLKFLLLPLILILIIQNSEATHVMGADIEWECLGKDTFKITVNVYRDCNGIAMGAKKINLSSSCGTKSKTATTSSGIDITPVCDNKCSRCEATSCTFQYGIEAYEQTAIFVLDDWRKKGCCEVTISWDQCCRNSAITTGASNNDFYVEATMNICLDQCDNSPVFTNSPMVLGCIGKNFIYNLGMQDQDVDSTGALSDSLVYSFTEPLQDSNTAVSWNSPFSYDKPLSYLGFPRTGLKFPQGIHLDSANGDLKFRPMRSEQTIICIKVEEYRDGKKIGETRRDIIFIVIKCPNNNPPVVSAISCTSPKPENFKTAACVGEQICFDICASDKDKNDTLRMGWIGHIPKATFTITNPGGKSDTGRFCWTPTESDAGKTFSFVVYAEDNACPLKGYAARTFRIIVKKPPEAKCNVETMNCGNVEFTAAKNGEQKINEFEWKFYDEDTLLNSATGDTVQQKFKHSGEKPFKLIAKGQTGCKATYLDTVSVTNFLQIEKTADTTACAQSILNLHADAKNSVGSYDIEWSTGDKQTNMAGSTKIALGLADTFVVVNIKDQECSAKDTIFIKVNDTLAFDLGKDARICPEESHVFRPIFLRDSVIQSNKSGLTFNWYKKRGGPSVASSDSLIARDSSSYYLLVENAQCRYADSVNLHVNPKRDWVPNESSVCKGDAVSLTVKPTSAGSSFSWYNSTSDNIVAHTGTSWTRQPKSSKWFGVEWKETIGGVECSEFDSVYVQVKPLPEVNLSKDTLKMYTTDSSHALVGYILKGKGNGVGNWSGNGVEQKQGDFYFSPTLVDNKAGEYQVIYAYEEQVGSRPYCNNKDTLIVTLKDSISTSTKALEERINLELFPNPAEHLIHIRTDLKGHLKIVNSLGQIVFDGQMDGNLSLGVQSYRNGVYLVKFITISGETHTSRFVKK